ncbi:hypothetical protein Misp01_03410 [Microtetraspora sp. NBRC 13810]|uniref:copper resistance CopC family protein n=1 Tax=Microtetraspora sp. NBRC 13810 TaxID=3030990 RepID=UPI00249FD3BC|nr:copper resistance protein CopC [Microtetraspora sp. NBRC 13810]GLW05211.1 hypothetical protein Misp01_03410 [Microtetraspora sp. NBRC 13810]
MSRHIRPSAASSAGGTATDGPAPPGRVPVRRDLWRVMWSLLLAFSGCVALTVAAPPAAAHGQLATSTPAAGSTLSEPMESVALYFTEPPVPHAYFTIFSPSGVRVDRPWSPGAPKTLDEPVRELHRVNGAWEPRFYHLGHPAEIPVGYWPEQGDYIVSYLTVASDGETVRGDVRFTYRGEMSQPPKGWKTPGDGPDPELVAATSGHGAAAGPSPAPTVACTPRTVPETGCATHASPSGSASPGAAAGTPGAAAGTTSGGAAGGGAEAVSADPAAGGSGPLVWLVPALVVLGAGVMVVRAARRPSTAQAPYGGPAEARPGPGKNPRTPPSPPPSPPTSTKRPGKTRKRR